MPRKPTVPCTRCGALLWQRATSRPASERVCRPCQRAALPRLRRRGETTPGGEADSQTHAHRESVTGQCDASPANDAPTPPPACPDTEDPEGEARRLAGRASLAPRDDRTPGGVS